MIKPAFFIGTMLFSIHAFAVSLTDLNSSLHGANQVTQIEPKMIYGGRDIIDSKTMTAAQSKVS